MCPIHHGKLNKILSSWHAQVLETEDNDDYVIVTLMPYTILKLIGAHTLKHIHILISPAPLLHINNIMAVRLWRNTSIEKRLTILILSFSNMKQKSGCVCALPGRICDIISIPNWANGSVRISSSLYFNLATCILIQQLKIEYAAEDWIRTNSFHYLLIWKHRILVCSQMCVLVLCRK